jgi:hypothetical protein
MTREIKFRAWNTDHIPPTFDYFTLGELDNGDMMGIKPCDEMPIMQYTGLKDKNGKEIYEGDVIQMADGSRGQVIFKDGSFQHTAPFTINGLLFWNEVIGNIYEHPHLVYS